MPGEAPTLGFLTGTKKSIKGVVAVGTQPKRSPCDVPDCVNTRHTANEIMIILDGEPRAIASPCPWKCRYPAPVLNEKLMNQNLLGLTVSSGMPITTA